ncbi:hypothetical protein [Streptomyces sp. PU_AKi4]|uniref:hypothetical protein n=1 Tax=Streptomyces sp. PU_AKi4 TaxID=2800809 RepID=UPI0035247D9D
MAGLKRSRLEVLARTPLMASMLCQLYAADPARPLPDGRTGAYELFVELIYEQNSHKQVASTHDKAIRELKDRYQIPRDNEAVEQAAQRVRYHLPELIDHLAYERINGSTAPAVEVLASHPQASRPRKVRQQLWNSFLTDLLRPTGILTQRADDFDFLHQTLLEYHAARHATRDEQARTQLLHDLIASSRAPHDDRMKLPALDDSYLGFLLDGLLAPQDLIAAKTIQYVEELTARGGEKAGWFLTTQVHLRTNLPLRPTAAQLARFATDPTLDQRGVFAHQSLPALAAAALAEVGGEAAAAHLTRLFGDLRLSPFSLGHVALALAEVGGEASAAPLARLASDATLHGDNRVEAAEILARVDRDAAAAPLARLASDATLGDDSRMWAALALTQADEDVGAALLARLADDATLRDDSRMRAALALAEVDGELGAPQLARFIGYVFLHDKLHVRAAEALARLADDTTLDRALRVRVAEALAQLDRVAGAALLARLAEDTTLYVYRVAAAEALARVSGGTAVPLLTRLAEDTTLHHDYRVQVAEVLARVGGKGAVSTSRTSPPNAAS